MGESSGKTHFKCNKAIGAFALVALFNILTGVDAFRVASQDKEMSDLFQAKVADTVGKAVGVELSRTSAGNVVTMLTTGALLTASLTAGFVGNGAGVIAAEISEEAARMNQPYQP